MEVTEGGACVDKDKDLAIQSATSNYRKSWKLNTIRRDPQCAMEQLFKTKEKDLEIKHLSVSRVPLRILHLIVGKPSFWCASYL